MSLDVSCLPSARLDDLDNKKLKNSPLAAPLQSGETLCLGLILEGLVLEGLLVLLSSSTFVLFDYYRNNCLIANENVPVLSLLY